MANSATTTTANALANVILSQGNTDILAHVQTSQGLGSADMANLSSMSSLLNPGQLYFIIRFIIAFGTSYANALTQAAKLAALQSTIASLASLFRSGTQPASGSTSDLINYLVTNV
jgi:hypothetical protein